MHLIDSLLGGARGVIDQGNSAGPGRSRYSDWINASESMADHAWDGPMNLLFHPRRTVRGLLGKPQPQRDWGQTARNAGSMGTKLGEGVYAAAYRGVRLGGSIINALGGGRGIATGVGLAGSQLIGGGLRTLQGMELGARFMLTGGFGPQPKSALEAYLPGWNRHGWEDIRKYAVNPRIPRRYVGLQVARGVGAAFEEALNPTIAPPSMYVEAGGGIRHRNDLGASASYGQQVLGPNSLLSGYNQMSQAQKIALLDAVI